MPQLRCAGRVIARRRSSSSSCCLRMLRVRHHDSVAAAAALLWPAALRRSGPAASGRWPPGLAASSSAAWACPCWPSGGSRASCAARKQLAAAAAAGGGSSRRAGTPTRAAGSLPSCRCWSAGRASVRACAAGVCRLLLRAGSVGHVRACVCLWSRWQQQKLDNNLTGTCAGLVPCSSGGAARRHRWSLSDCSRRAFL